MTAIKYPCLQHFHCHSNKVVKINIVFFFLPSNSEQFNNSCDILVGIHYGDCWKFTFIYFQKICTGCSYWYQYITIGYAILSGIPQNLLSFVDVINPIKLILLSSEWSKHNISCYFQVEKQKIHQILTNRCLG